MVRVECLRSGTWKGCQCSQRRSRSHRAGQRLSRGRSLLTWSLERFRRAGPHAGSGLAQARVTLRVVGAPSRTPARAGGLTVSQSGAPSRRDPRDPALDA